MWLGATAILVAVVLPMTPVYPRGDDRHDDGNTREASQTDKSRDHDGPHGKLPSVAAKPDEKSPAGTHFTHPMGPKPVEVIHPMGPMAIAHPSEHVWVEHHEAPMLIAEYRPERERHGYHPEHIEKVVVVHEDHRPRWHFHTDPTLIIGSIILAGAIIASQDHSVSPPPAAPMDPVSVAKRQGTYFSNRDECFANFKAKFLGVYTNTFATEPKDRPGYLPNKTVCDGKTVYIVYCLQYHDYGFWDPSNQNNWINYSVWDDDTMVDQLMLRNYYLYPTT